MKNSKIKQIILLTVILFGICGTGFSTSVDIAEASQVKTGNQYGYVNTRVFPKSWKGFWGGKGNFGPIINESFGSIFGNCGVAEYGYVKGTKNYPWQMSANVYVMEEKVPKERYIYTC